MSNVRVRFAPSPTGKMHIGGIRTALWNWLYAAQHNGTFILRIEDTDQKRKVDGGIEYIIEALKWYGLDYDEGPVVGGDFGPYIQSERREVYRQYSDQLIASGHAYYAYDTPERLAQLREDQQKRGLPPGYDRRHRYLAAAERADYERSGIKPVVRFAVPPEGKTSFKDTVYGELTFENRVLDDQVILKSDGMPTYHLANVVDDHLMQISHVFRGEEWIPSAPLHMLIYQAFGWEPPTFMHLAVMLNKTGKKLAKRDGAMDALAYRDEGYLREAVLNFLALQGWSGREDRDLYSIDDLLEKFSVDGLLNRSPKVDFDKMSWYNGVYIRSLPQGRLAQKVLPFLQESGLAEPNPSEQELNYIAKVIALEQERMRTLAEAVSVADFFWLGDDEFVFDEKAVGKWFRRPSVGDYLRAVLAGFAALSPFDLAGTDGVVRDVAASFKLEKAGEIIHPLRVAVTGRTTGPGLFETIVVLGRERVLRRLDRALRIVDVKPV